MFPMEQCGFPACAVDVTNFRVNSDKPDFSEKPVSFSNTGRMSDASSDNLSFDSLTDDSMTIAFFVTTLRV